MSKKREKASKAEDKPFISVVRSMRPGEVSDCFQPTQRAVARARMGPALLARTVPSTATCRRREPSGECAKNLKYFRRGNKMYL